MSDDSEPVEMLASVASALERIAEALEALALSADASAGNTEQIVKLMTSIVVAIRERP